LLAIPSDPVPQPLKMCRLLPDLNVYAAGPQVGERSFEKLKRRTSGNIRSPDAYKSGSGKALLEVIPMRCLVMEADIIY
jgi:hypothetical protein